MYEPHQTHYRTYQDLLVAIHSSRSQKGFDRLLRAEQLARQLLTNKNDAKLVRSFQGAVEHLVRWIDEPFCAQDAEALIVAHVRETTDDLSGRRIRHRVDGACPVCGMAFTGTDVRRGRKVFRHCSRHDGLVVARFRCSRCRSIWEDAYRLEGRRIADDPAQRVILDGRF